MSWLVRIGALGLAFYLLLPVFQGTLVASREVTEAAKSADVGSSNERPPEVIQPSLLVTPKDHVASIESPASAGSSVPIGAAASQDKISSPMDSVAADGSNESEAGHLRAAVDLLLSGDTRGALDGYRGLLARRKGSPEFALAVRILEREVVRCAGGGSACTR
ncbi:MAG: hypothetical protein QM778_36510 [Myxococcales bacterium]